MKAADQLLDVARRAESMASALLRQRPPETALEAIVTMIRDLGEVAREFGSDTWQIRLGSDPAFFAAIKRMPNSEVKATLYEDADRGDYVIESATFGDSVLSIQAQDSRPATAEEATLAKANLKHHRSEYAMASIPGGGR